MSWACRFCGDTGLRWVPSPVDPEDVDKEFCECEAGEERHRATRLA